MYSNQMKKLCEEWFRGVCIGFFQQIISNSETKLHYANLSHVILLSKFYSSAAINSACMNGS
jgi:hypothetical protein